MCKTRRDAPRGCVPGGETMNRLWTVLLVVAVTCTFVGCSKDTAEEASATGVQPADSANTADASAATKPVARKIDAPAPAAPRVTAPRTFEIPEGTELT